jgi:hypothetical protein
LQNLDAQGCTLNNNASPSISAFTVPLTKNGTCSTFSSFGVPFQVKSAQAVSAPSGYNCQVDFNNKCGDSQGTYAPITSPPTCETANKYFEGVYILCKKT